VNRRLSAALVVSLVILCGELATARAAEGWEDPARFSENPGWLSPFLSDVAVGGEEVRVVWVSQSESLFEFHDGVAESSDAGRTFVTTEIPGSSGSAFVSPVVVANAQGGFVYLWMRYDSSSHPEVLATVESSASGFEAASTLYRSATYFDMGTSLMLTPGPGGEILAAYALPTSLQSSLSVDGGLSWSAAQPPLPSAPVSVWPGGASYAAGQYILLYAFFDGVNGTAELWLAHNERPATSPWQRTSIPDPGRVWQPTLAVAPNGTVVALWEEANSGGWLWSFSLPPYDSFTPPASPPFLRDAVIPYSVHIGVDPFGALHAVWLGGDAVTRTVGQDVQYARSTEDWRWSEPPVMLANSPGFSFSSPLLGIDERGVASVVWGGGDSLGRVIGYMTRQSPPWVTQDFPPGRIVTDPFVVHGTTEANATAQVRIDDGSWSNASGGHVWTYRVDTTGMKVGNHDFEIRACNDRGVCSEAKVVPFGVASSAILFMTIGLAAVVPIIVLGLGYRVLRRRRSKAPPMGNA